MTLATVFHAVTQFWSCFLMIRLIDSTDYLSRFGWSACVMLASWKLYPGFVTLADRPLWTEHFPTLHVQTQTFCQHVTHDIARSRVAQVVLSIKNISSSCHLSGTTLSSSISPTLSGSCSTSFQPRTCADPHGLGGDGFTESDPLTGYEPKTIGAKTIGDKMVGDIFNPIVKRVLTLPKITSSTLLKKVKFRK